MWLMPCSRITSSVRSASAFETSPSAAAPKITRLDSCPVAPKGARSIMSGRIRIMKRSPALAPLSHDHHHALDVARRLRRADAEDLDEVLAYLVEFWRTIG